MSKIVNVGSRKNDLQIIAENIFYICRKNRIDLTVNWVPREHLRFADTLSRMIDHDDWQVKEELYNNLNQLWGPFTVDRVADNDNKKICRFYSKFYCPNTEGVNALNYDWKGENNYIVPPTSLVGKVLKHMKTSKCKGVIVLPYWPSAYFWPLLFSENKTAITDRKVFGDPKVCVTQGKNKKCFIGSEKFVSPILAVNLDFS